MKILVSCIPYDDGKSGISVYIRETVRALAARGHDLTLILEPNAIAAFPGFKHILFPPRKPLLAMLYHLFVLPHRIPWQDFDCCLVAAANRRMFYRLPIHTVPVVHDLSQYHVQAKYDPFRTFYIKHVLPHYVRKARTVVAISHSTAEDLKEHWHVPADRIRVILNGLTVPDHLPDLPAGTLPSKPFILYVSRLEHPGKNHVNLIKAYDRLPEHLLQRYDLLLPGAPWSGAEAVYEAAKTAIHAQNIRLPGFIDDALCHALLARAACYVFPSLYEGFGLSLVEAMYNGVPCTCSNTSSLREIGHNAALLFNPQDPKDIARQLANILDSPTRQRELSAQGRQRAKLYDWKITAQQLENALVPPRPTIFGVPCDNVTVQRALEQLTELIAKGRRTRTPSIAAFINAHCLNIAKHHPQYTAFLQNIDAVWPDGAGVRLAGKILGFPVPDNVNGTDFFPPMAQQGHSFFFLGAAPGVAKQALKNSQKAYPQSAFLGSAPGFFKSTRHEQNIIDKINRLKPDILLVAMGVPRQELWVRKHLHELHCGVIIPVGGLFDFLSHRIPRAPKWLRNHGLEWTFRLYCEPRRMFRRYIIGNPLFVCRLLLHKLFR